MDATIGGRFRFWMLAAAAVCAGEPGAETTGLFDKGATQIYQGEFLSGILFPVGGIGTGNIWLDGNARRPRWWTWGEWETGEKPVGNSLFAVRAQAAGGNAQVRALQTQPEGAFKGMQSLAFRGEYPFGRFDFQDAGLPVEVSLEAYNPLIPMDARNSAIPCAIFNLTAKNAGAAEVDVSFLATQRNFIGSGAATGFGGNSNRIVKEDSSTFLLLGSQQAAQGRYYGDLALMAYRQDAAGTASFPSLDSLASAFAARGAPSGPAAAGPSASGTPLDGALSVPFHLKAGESRTVTFVLTWHYPNRKPRWNDPMGPRYSAWWPNAQEVARYLNKQLPDLERRTRLFHDAVYASNLPVWMLDGLTANLGILRSPTCFWNKDGYFGVNEGWRPDTHVDGNCTHVMHYAQAHAFLFPEIARQIREEELALQFPNGGIPFRTWEKRVAFDGQSGEILSAYREYKLSKDGSWLARCWPKIKKAMQYSIATWDADQDGIPSGNQWETLDANINGDNSWLGSLYLASLAASAKMADLQGDTAFAAQCRRIFAAGSAGQDKALFNGEYYVQIPENLNDQSYGDGVITDQLLGQYWANLLGLGSLYPPDHEKTALASLFKYNFHHDFKGYDFMRWRRFVSDTDSGLIIASWPKGDRPANPLAYHPEAMTGFEYAASALMIQSGLLDQGFRVFRGVRGRYDGRVREGWYSGPGGNPFDEIEWGYYYFRAMASWAALPSAQGYAYDGPSQSIAFRPVVSPADHASFFSAAEGWGTFAQTRAQGIQKESLELLYGSLALRELDFTLDPGYTGRNVQVTYGGSEIPASVSWKGSDAHIELGATVTLTAGEKLAIALGAKPTGIDPASRLPASDGIRCRLRGGSIEVTLPGGAPAQAELDDISGHRWALQPGGIPGGERGAFRLSYPLPAGLEPGRYVLKLGYPGKNRYHAVAVLSGSR